jgi:hypothetical protein
VGTRDFPATERYPNLNMARTPTLALWFLRTLGSGDSIEVLIGDLTEECEWGKKSGVALVAGWSRNRNLHEGENGAATNTRSVAAAAVAAQFGPQFLPLLRGDHEDNPQNDWYGLN